MPTNKSAARRYERSAARIHQNTPPVDLDSLLSVGASVKPTDPKWPGIEYVSISDIQADPHQPRRDFKGLGELVESITTHGVLQPVLVTPVPTWDKRRPQVHTIIVGERRWRAAQEAGLEHVPAVVRDVDEKTALELQLTENVQRKELQPAELAEGCTRLITEHGLSMRDLAKRIHMDPGQLSRIINVSKDPALNKAVVAGDITYTQAQEMVALEARSKMALVKQITQQEKATGQKVTVPQVRAMARELQPATRGKSVVNHNTPARDPYAQPVALASKLRQTLITARYVADVAEGGHQKQGELDEAAAVAREIIEQCQRVIAAAEPKAKRKSA